MSEHNTVEYQAFLRQRRAELQERIEDAARRVGRDPSDITLVAVSKTVGDGEVEQAYQIGYREFGENRPQELKRKVTSVRNNPDMKDARFHMIGNLQKNKINQVLGNATLVHSVSSAHLAQAISQRSLTKGRVTPCLLEVNVSGEASKSGFSLQDIDEAVDMTMKLEGVSLQGLMTMAPAGDLDAARSCFSGLRELRDKLVIRIGMPLSVLSCGMSDDFEVAVEEGSTLVRLGRIVFDPTYTSQQHKWIV